MLVILCFIYCKASVCNPVHRIRKYTEGPLSGATCRPFLFLCKNYAVSGQKAEQPASTACLLAVLLINMHLSCWSNGGQHALMRYAWRHKLQSFRREWPFCIYPHSVSSVSFIVFIDEAFGFEISILERPSRPRSSLVRVLN